MMVLNDLEEVRQPEDSGEEVTTKINRGTNLFLLAQSSPSPIDDCRLQQQLPSKRKQITDHHQEDEKQQQVQLQYDESNQKPISLNQQQQQQQDDGEASVPLDNLQKQTCSQETIILEPEQALSTSFPNMSPATSIPLPLVTKSSGHEERHRLSLTQQPTKRTARRKQAWKSQNIQPTQEAVRPELALSSSSRNNPLTAPMPVHLASTSSGQEENRRLSLTQQPNVYMSRNGSLQPQTIPPLTLQRTLNDREQFLMFVKILFRLMDKEPNIDQVKKRVSAVIAECTLKSRNNDPEYVPLSTAIERKLQPILHHQIWNKAQLMLNYYIRNQQQQREQKQQQQQSAAV